MSDTMQAKMVSDALQMALWRRGKPVDMGRLGGFVPEPLAVNDAGWVVGAIRRGKSDAQAVLHDGRQFHVLLGLCNNPKGWRQLSQASAISSDGRIAGFGIFEGKPRAFRLDPIR